MFFVTILYQFEGIGFPYDSPPFANTLNFIAGIHNYDPKVQIVNRTPFLQSMVKKKTNPQHVAPL